MTREKCNKDAENKKLGTLRQVTKERVVQNVERIAGIVDDTIQFTNS